MQDTIEVGKVLIREGSPLPEALKIESEPCVPGWAIVTNLDGSELDRRVRATGWTFFYLALEIKATVFGSNKRKMTRRAIKQILANPKAEKFNSLEITRSASAGTNRFPLLGYVTVSARSRHVQESPYLSQPQDLPRFGKKSSSAGQEAATAGATEPLSQEGPEQPSAVPLVIQ